MAAEPRRSRRSKPVAPLPERLLDAVQRLLAARDEAALHRAVASETRALLGAARVLLMLHDVDGAMRVAASNLPRGEPVQALVHAVTPWLDEARASGTGRLVHGPAGADAAQQRSCLIVPLRAHARRHYIVYADVDGRDGRFGDAELQLLTRWAAVAVQALEASSRRKTAVERRLAQRERDADVAKAAQ